ncbi:MAG: zinc-ribbon domain-containing protein [Ruminococcus flavefaciens]|nr:zinc-ribbon domain-containing protein [Ruminococcus flavefaciens]MCM1061457.1 zinc-ribbon domain-containing protein [Eubacterium sp.]
MFCKNCGNEVKDGVKFCSKCGVEQTLYTDLPEKVDNETIKNDANVVSLDNGTAVKKKSGIISGILAIVIVIVFILAAIAGVRWVFSTVGFWFDNKDGTGKQASERIDAKSIISSHAEPAIRINEISFDSSINSIKYEFENISDKDIAYITFETYFYDRMGGALTLDNGSDDYALNMNYTGPLYAGSMDSAYWEYLFEMPTGTAVVYPKYITITFTDDEEITFENTVYCHSEDFYGGELKDKK